MGSAAKTVLEEILQHRTIEKQLKLAKLKVTAKSHHTTLNCTLILTSLHWAIFSIKSNPFVSLLYPIYHNLH